TAETIKNEGQVSGDAMTVKAQWKKVYDILTAKVGHGTIDSSKTVDEGSSYSVSWKADEGYHVAQVMIDNGVHDELLGDGHSGSYTQPRADRNRTIYVIFEKDADTPSGEAHYYTVQTVKIGGDATTTLTETQTIAAGENHTVTWNAGDLYRVTGIVVDGSARPLQDGGSFTFSDMNADHRVEVHFEEKLPDSSPSALPGYYTVNTVRNEGGVITETGVVKEGASREIAWSEDAGYAVKSITIDGQPADAEIMAAKKVTFNDIREDHTVKAVFEKNGEALSTVKVPVETTLVGGPGEISSSAVVNKDESYKVEWNAPEDKRYLVDHILVNGERQEVAAEAVTTGHIEVKAEAETKVEVVLKPNLLKIATMVEGQGSIDPTKTVFYNDEAYTVAAKASDGWYIKS
ncbi:MAG: InlB B-repeat-containing protein, partial [Eubacterium callanderi]